MNAYLSQLHAVVVLVALGAFAQAAERPVHLEIVQMERGSVDAPAQWTDRLKRLSLTSLRVRSARPGDRPQVEQRGTTERPMFHVIGVLTARNELQLPGATFRLGEEQRLSKWLDALRASGASAAEPAGPFGLESAALAKLKRDLSPRWETATAGTPLRALVTQIQEQIRLPVAIDRSARAAISRPAADVDEYQGLAEGTVLAAALRPTGLGWVPEANERGAITVRIVAADAATEVWPVGWPSARRPQEAVPKLMEFLPVEIADTSLSETLAAIQPRLGVPLLLDRHALTRAGIDLDQVRVSHPAGRTFYKRLLDRILFQGRLEVAIREDDGGRPFLWVAPIRRTRPER